MAANGLADQIHGVSADLTHGAVTIEDEAILALHLQCQLGAAYIVHAIGFIKETDEGADGAGSIVILRFAKQKGRATLNIAQVHIIAEGGALHRTATVHRQHDFRLGIIPPGSGMQADIGPMANGREHLGLAEHFRIRTDAHLQIL